MRRVCKRNPNGPGYIIKGKQYDKCVGSRAEVGHKTAYRTSGGLTHSDLKQNKHGRWVSKRLSTRAKKEKRLVKAGYLTKKGKFGAVKSGKTVKRRRSRKSKSSKKR